MEWKKIGKKLLFPPGWIMILLTVFSATALVWVFIKNRSESPIAYAIYVTAFYTVTVLCIFLGTVLPKRYRKIRQKIYENPIGNRYMTDVEFKNQVSLHCSLAVNLFYAGTNAFSAGLYRTAWFGIFAGYYTILAVMRYLLVRYIHKNKLGENRLQELRRARLCAIILTTINLLLPGAVLMMLFQNRGFEYQGILIYVMAMYTFYITTMAFGDGPLPLFKRRVAQTMIMTMLNQAQDYVYMMSPYLIIDNELCQTIENAALRGVDVRIITPHIPDKKLIFTMTRSHYSRLMNVGVKIYEYEPGFVHAKAYLSDDKYAIVGTINLDYRSLVHHFENGVWLYKHEVLEEIKADMNNTMDQSIPVTEDLIKNTPLQRFIHALVKVVSPML